MPGGETKFFVSYAREDKEFVLKLANDLRAAGANLWVDQLDIRLGDEWDTAVEKALEACGGVLLILSPDAVASTNVMAEVNYALEETKRVLPVIVRKCKIPFRLRRLQYVDLAAVGEETGTAQLRAALTKQGQPEAGRAKEQPPLPQVEVEDKKAQQRETKQEREFDLALGAMRNAESPQPDVEPEQEQERGAKAATRPERNQAIGFWRTFLWLASAFAVILATLAVLMVHQYRRVGPADQAAEEQSRRDEEPKKQQAKVVFDRLGAPVAASRLLSSCTSQRWEEWIPAPADWPTPELWGFVVDAHVQGNEVVGQVSKFSHGSAPETHPIAHGTISGSEFVLTIGDTDSGPATYLHGTAKDYGFEVTETSMGPPMFKDDDGAGFFKLRCRPGRTVK